MEIERSFYIRVDEKGNQYPMMEFFPPKYSMLAHLGFEEFSKSDKIKYVLKEINKAIKRKQKYSFASDDWCIVEVLGEKCIIRNGFEEFEPFEVDTSFMLNLLNDWMNFLIKYESKQIPGI
ncbi:hypothetical protein AB9K32_04310 [Allomuricauda sp. XS_ASV26]|uniref:hypothetical protein n=1 Tax=Allomuricauda sp. XS_ASV26 TaxID=3241292 RepID=UPI00351663F6